MQQIGNNKYKLVSNAFQNQLKLAFQFFLIANPKVPGREQHSIFCYEGSGDL